MQSPDIDMLDFQRFFDLDHNISFSPLHAAIQLPQSPAQHAPAEAIRNRTRNPRSCDICRARKTACVIESVPPCTTCKSKGKECVFTERAQKRRRHDVSDSRSYTNQISTSSQPAPFIPAQHVSSPTPLAPPRPTVPDHASLGSDPHLEIRQWTTESPEDDSINRRANPSRDLSGHDHEFEESLDLRPTSTTFVLGETGEADPYLLKHPSLAAHAENIKFRQIYRDKNAMNENGQYLDTERPLIFMMGEHSLYDKYEPRVEDTALDEIRKELDRIGDDVGVRLIMLYFKHIYPYFPLLSRSRMFCHGRDVKGAVSSLPLSLKAALYASALPFMVYDDYLSTILDVDPPSAQALYRMVWTAITHEIHTPHLSTLQSCLLLLQRDNPDHFVQCSPFQLSLMAWTVGLAQTLALSTDCSTWRGIPAWEKRLRRRLWWATYVLDKWTLLTAGLTSHIKDDDFDVLPLTAADFVSDADGSIAQDSPSGNASYELPHFFHLVQLTTTLADIHCTFFTIKASTAVASDFGRTSGLAKSLRSRLYSWKGSFDRFHSLQQTNPESRIKLDGNASLGVAYFAVTILLFRAIMRPLESSHGSMDDVELRESSRESVRLGAKACCAEILDYLEQVPPGAWNAFWHKFSQSNFAIASSFMMRLLITSTSQEEINTLNNLIDRWRWAMRIGGGNSGSQLTSLGLLRLDRTLLKSGIQVSREG